MTDGEEPSDFSKFKPVTAKVIEVNEIMARLKVQGTDPPKWTREEVQPIVEAVVDAYQAHLARTLNDTFSPLFTNLGGFMAIHEAVYETPGQVWRIGRSGVVWLHPRCPYRFTLVTGTSLELYFDPDATRVDEATGEDILRDWAVLEPAGKTAGRILLGPQLFEKLIPFQINLNSTDPATMPNHRLLIQMNVKGYPYAEPLLRVDYATFYRELKEGEE